MTGIDTPAAAPEQGSHRALRLAVGAAAVVVLLLGLSQLSRIVGPFFLALNLMVVVWPVQRFLSRRLHRVLAAILSGLLAIVIIGLLFWAIGWAGSLFIQEIPQYKGQFQTMYADVLNLAGQFGITSSQILDQLQSINPGSVVSVVTSLITNVGGAVSLFVVVITVLIFMVVDSIDFEARLERLVVRHNPVLVLALNSFAQGVRRYWVTSTVFGLIVSTLTWAGLAAYGIPLAIVWAVLAFVTNYIPNIGFIIGLVPAAVMGLLAKGPWGALFVILLYAVLNFVIQGVVQPKVAGEAVGVTSTVSFLSLLVWAVVLGPLGALLALPATLFVKALVVDADPKAIWVNALIASNPKTSDEEPVLGDEGSAPAESAESAPVVPLVAESAPVVPLVAESLPAAPPVTEDAPTGGSTEIDDEPRRSLGDQPTEEAEAVDEVVPRHSADPENEGPTEEAPLEAASADPEPLDAEPVSSVTLDAEPVDSEPLDAEPLEVEPLDAATAEAPLEGEETDAAEDPTALAEETAADVAEPVEESEPEDVPRRARADDDPRAFDDEWGVPDDFPVFQKSATPYWTGVSSHAED